MVLAINAFMKAMYDGNNYARQDGKEKLKKLYKKWGQRQKEGCQ